jgi:hypothetical protein
MILPQEDHADELHRTSGTQAADATDQTVVTSNQAAALALVFTQPKIGGPYISGRKEGHEFRNNLVRQGTLHSA